MEKRLILVDGEVYYRKKWRPWTGAVRTASIKKIRGIIHEFDDLNIYTGDGSEPEWEINKAVSLKANRIVVLPFIGHFSELEIETSITVNLILSVEFPIRYRHEITNFTGRWKWLFNYNTPILSRLTIYTNDSGSMNIFARKVAQETFETNSTILDIIPRYRILEL